MAIPTLAMIPSGYKAGKLYSVLPSDGTGDFTVARNSVATRVNQSGLVEEVAANVPRLDYSAGGCPVLLTEIESTNLVTYSEDFSNAAWSKLGSTVVTSNYGVSPSGNNNSSLVTFGDKTSSNQLYFNVNTSASNYTSSIYLRVSSGTAKFKFGFFDGSFKNTEIIVTSEWQRFSYSQTLSSSSSTRACWIYPDSIDASLNLEIYGAQTEQQPAVTSYIKTTGTIQTREADLVTGAGSTATFNSLEHTFFVDLNSVFESSASSSISIVGSDTDNRIRIRKESNNTQVQFQIRSGGANVAGETLSSIDFSVRQKLAVTVKENEVKYYRNGFLLSTNTGTIPLPVSLGELILSQFSTGSPLAASTKDIRYYNQVLTAADTLELMSYDSFNEMASALQYTIK